MKFLILAVGIVSLASSCKQNEPANSGAENSEETVGAETEAIRAKCAKTAKACSVGGGGLFRGPNVYVAQNPGSATLLVRFQNELKEGERFCVHNKPVNVREIGTKQSGVESFTAVCIDEGQISENTKCNRYISEKDVRQCDK